MNITSISALAGSVSRTIEKAKMAPVIKPIRFAIADRRSSNWKTIYQNGMEIVQENKITGHKRSSMYDMAYGGTFWEHGDRWSPNRQ